MSELKRSEGLIFTATGDGVSVYNVINGHEFECRHNLIGVLLDMDGWGSHTELRTQLLPVCGAETDAVISGLLDVEAVVAKGTTPHRAERDFVDNWQWGLPSAILHQAVTGGARPPVEEQIAFQKSRAAEAGVLDLVYRPQETDRTFALARPDRTKSLFRHFGARRTVREGESYTMSRTALSDTLFAAFGITGWTENEVGSLPLKFAPSGGARNPFDGYVLVADVEGLIPGLYRYCGADHCLETVPSDVECSFSAVMGGQEWANNAACLILLVADFARPMWKYAGDDNAYRVVLIEAGHIGQNIMLAASDHGLSACASAALNHEITHAMLGIDRCDQAAVYALAINRPPFVV